MAVLPYYFVVENVEFNYQYKYTMRFCNFSRSPYRFLIVHSSEEPVQMFELNLFAKIRVKMSRKLWEKDNSK